MKRKLEWGEILDIGSIIKNIERIDKHALTNTTSRVGNTNHLVVLRGKVTSDSHISSDFEPNQKFVIKVEERIARNSGPTRSTTSSSSSRNTTRSFAPKCTLLFTWRMSGLQKMTEYSSWKLTLIDLTGWPFLGASVTTFTQPATSITLSTCKVCLPSRAWDAISFLFKIFFMDIKSLEVHLTSRSRRATVSKSSE